MHSPVCVGHGRKPQRPVFSQRGSCLLRTKVWLLEVLYIRITCPCDLYPITPHSYIVRLRCTGVYIFLIFALKHRLWVLVRTASVRRFQHIPSIYVLSKSKKNIIIFHLKINIYTAVKYCCIFGRVFIMLKTFHLRSCFKSVFTTKRTPTECSTPLLLTCFQINTFKSLKSCYDVRVIYTTYITLLYSTIMVYRGIHYFLIF